MTHVKRWVEPRARQSSPCRGREIMRPNISPANRVVLNLDVFGFRLSFTVGQFLFFALQLTASFRGLLMTVRPYNHLKNQVLVLNPQIYLRRNLPWYASVLVHQHC